MAWERSARLHREPAAAHRMALGAEFRICTSGSTTPWPARAMARLAGELGQYARACTAPAAAACCCRFPVQQVHASAQRVGAPCS